MPLASPKCIRKCQYVQDLRREMNRKILTICQISGFSSNLALSEFCGILEIVNATENPQSDHIFLEIQNIHSRIQNVSKSVNTNKIVKENVTAEFTRFFRFLHLFVESGTVVFCYILEIANATENPQSEHTFAEDSKNPLANPKCIRKCQYEQNFKRECSRKIQTISRFLNFVESGIVVF